jgi:hypothetical protein
MTDMAYDFDGLIDRGPPKVDAPTPHPTDLEAIVSLMTLAAIDLTPAPNTPFTFEQLFAAANDIGNPEIVLREVDVRIVLPYTRFLKKVSRNLYCLR